MLHQTKLQLLRTVKLFAELDYVSKAKSYDIFGYLGLIFLKFLKINLGRKGLRVLKHFLFFVRGGNESTSFAFSHH